MMKNPVMENYFTSSRMILQKSFSFFRSKPIGRYMGKENFSMKRKRLKCRLSMADETRKMIDELFAELALCSEDI